MVAFSMVRDEPLAINRKLRVGGVPEHFNAPFRIGSKQGIFKKHGCDIEWVEQACGTGEMVRNLRNGTLDVAIALTEGKSSAHNLSFGFYGGEVTCGDFHLNVTGILEGVHRLCNDRNSIH